MLGPVLCPCLCPSALQPPPNRLTPPVGLTLPAAKARLSCCRLDLLLKSELLPSLERDLLTGAEALLRAPALGSALLLDGGFED